MVEKKVNKSTELEEKLNFLMIEYTQLKKHTTRLERALARHAHQTGSDNIMRAFKIDTFVPKRENMSRWKE
jgi:hypothetical protein